MFSVWVNLGILGAGYSCDKAIRAMDIGVFLGPRVFCNKAKIQW